MLQKHKPPPAPVVRYGDHPDQVANLHLPAGDGAPWPCVVLLHGGFWRERWDRTLMTPLACDLASRGIAAWNVEYRRVGQAGGGWPGTLEDVAAAADTLGAQEAIDPTRVTAVGHSAGGQLALWLASRRDHHVRLRSVASLAGVCDLVTAAQHGLGDDAVQAFLGGTPGDRHGRYAAASPAALLPLGVEQMLVHGREDEIVPPAQSRAYAVAALAAGDTVELVELDGADHFDVVDPAGDAWLAVLAWLEGTLGQGADL